MFETSTQDRVQDRLGQEATGETVREQNPSPVGFWVILWAGAVGWVAFIVWAITSVGR